MDNELIAEIDEARYKYVDNFVERYTVEGKRPSWPHAYYTFFPDENVTSSKTIDERRHDWEKRIHAAHHLMGEQKKEKGLWKKLKTLAGRMVGKKITTTNTQA